MGFMGKADCIVAVFDPEKVHALRARRFYAGLQKRWIEQRQSRRPLPQGSLGFAPGAIAVFLQGVSIPVERAQYMSERDMVKTTLNRSGGCQVLVKPHPLRPEPGLQKRLEKLQIRWPNLHLVDANVHDMLCGARLCCSISSSVSVEVMLHVVLVMLFGKSDLHHCAVTVETGAQFVPVYAMAQDHGWPYASFLFWFLQRGIINMDRDIWYEKITERMGPAFAQWCGAAD